VTVRIGFSCHESHHWRVLTRDEAEPGNLSAALALGTDIGGNATLVGASADVVEASLLFCSRRNLLF
jgi:Na+/H+ antiporter NhaD/arsenite permease-like protein